MYRANSYLKSAVCALVLLTVGIACQPSGPSVVRVVPANGSGAVDRQLTLQVEFDDSIDPGSLVSGQSVLLESGGRVIGGDIILYGSGKALLFRPQGHLLPGASYRFSLTTGIRDRKGRALKSSWSGRFTTSRSLPHLEALPGKLPAGLFFHTATALKSGLVLVAGGTSLDPGGSVPPVPSATAYRLDPKYGTLQSVSMKQRRIRHTATPLTNGEILLAGGDLGPSTEFYSETTGAFRSGPDLGTARMAHSATMLANGKVLFAGGVRPSIQCMGYSLTRLATAEIYDPGTGKIRSVGSMKRARIGHTATLLASGKVLVAGGHSSLDLELFDPVQETFQVIGSLVQSREDHRATLLANGWVLLTGGSDARGKSLPHAELYDPSSHRTRVTAGAMGVAREDHTATLLPNGRVLITGGEDNAAGANGSDIVLDAVELYDPTTDRFVSSGPLSLSRDDHTATLLSGGRVLLLGGEDHESRGIPTGETYRP